MSDNAILSALRRMGIPKDEMTGHGFRAMARTILDEVLGFRPDYIEHQLAHAVRDPLGRAYNRTAHLEGRRTMMQVWVTTWIGSRSGRRWCRSGAGPPDTTSCAFPGRRAPFLGVAACAKLA